MQLHTFIAASATPFVALVNPGAIYIKNTPTQPPMIVADDKACPELKSGNFLPAPAAVALKDDRAVLKVDANGSGEPGGAVRALSRLRTFASWNADWDADGAPAPDRRSIDSAALMLGFLVTKLGRTPNVALNGDGEPTFTILDGEFELAVTVVSENEAAYFVAYGDQERGGLAEFDRRTLPPELALAVSELRPHEA